MLWKISQSGNTFTFDVPEILISKHTLSHRVYYRMIVHPKRMNKRGQTTRQKDKGEKKKKVELFLSMP
jgi:hypothetical protein